MNGLINERLLREYSVVEINALPEGYHDEDPQEISWEELKGKRNVFAERIRFVTDIGFPYYELSYFHVRIDGVKYEVLGHPFDQVPKENFKKILYNRLKRDGIFIMNFFDKVSTLK